MCRASIHVYSGNDYRYLCDVSLDVQQSRQLRQNCPSMYKRSYKISPMHRWNCYAPVSLSCVPVLTVRFIAFATIAVYKKNFVFNLIHPSQFTLYKKIAITKYFCGSQTTIKEDNNDIWSLVSCCYGVDRSP